MANALDFFDASLWAIDPDWFDRLRSALEDQHGNPVSLVARLGSPSLAMRGVETSGTTAIVPIIGPIFQYEGLLTDILGKVIGVTTLAKFSRDFRAAQDDPAIETIALEVNSPGGQVAGINEAAGMIANSRKPVVSYVSGMAASAAYWLGSAADRMVIDKTAQLGSIGVVMTIDQEQKKKGVTQVVSSQSPLKRADPNTPEGMAAMKSRVDAIADVFIDAVAENRGVSRETVLSQFGQGGVKVGQAALDAGMADSAGSLETTLAQLSGGYQARRRRKRPMAANEETTTEATVTEAAHKAAIETTRTEARSEGLTEGAKVERERLLGIDKISLPGHDKLTAQAKSEGWTVADFAIKQAESEKATRETRLQAMRADGQTTVQVTATATGDTPNPATDPSRPLEERCKAAWDASEALRSEFTTFEAFHAFKKNEGRIRILKTTAEKAAS